MFKRCVDGVVLRVKHRRCDCVIVPYRVGELVVHRRAEVVNSPPPHFVPALIALHDPGYPSSYPI